MVTMAFPLISQHEKGYFCFLTGTGPVNRPTVFQINNSDVGSRTRFQVPPGILRILAGWVLIF